MLGCKLVPVVFVAIAMAVMDLQIIVTGNVLGITVRFVEGRGRILSMSQDRLLPRSVHGRIGMFGASLANGCVRLRNVHDVCILAPTLTSGEDSAAV